jgi:hypothetical protein
MFSSFARKSGPRRSTRRPLSRRAGLSRGAAPERLEDRRLLANTVGLISYDVDAAYEGYTLFAPSNSNVTYLVDMEGNQVRSWQSQLNPMTAELLADGSLIRAGRVPTQGLAEGEAPKQWAPGVSGRIEKFDWDGNLVWSYTLATPDMHLHHDFEVKPNGNILAIAWERKTYAEAVQAGRRPNDVPRAPDTGVREIWPDVIIEIQPNQPAPGETVAEGGEIVWKWSAWDHLVQNIDPTKDNFGSVAANPQKIDINYYVKGIGMGGVPADWNHFNSVHYNPELEQIVVSPREFGEFWIIDQSTTTEEAAGETGGRAGKGGDLLYRWGNPAATKRGTWRNQQLFYQHDPYWIEPGLPGAGNMLVFDNGWSQTPQRPSFSRVLEIDLPDNPDQWQFSDSLGATRNPRALTRAAAVRTAANTTVVPEGWLPVSGDWNADGADSVGVFDPQTLTYHLYTDPSTSAGATVINALPDQIELQPASLSASDVSWLPVVGDFDGDGTDTVGLFDPATGRFLLNNDPTGWTDPLEVAASVPTAALARGWQPIVGDFDGDGTDTVGVYLPSVGQFRFTNDNAAWPATVAEGLGFVRLLAGRSQLQAGTPVVGDFTGSGTDTVGVYVPGQRTWLLAAGIPGVRQPVTRLRTAWAQPSWKPLVGDWNGSGSDTTGTYNPSYTETGYGSPVAPAPVVWRYFSNPRSQFFARIISGAQRLPNGNTLINEGTEGRFFEVTPQRRIVWQYINPVIGRGEDNILRQGQRPPVATQIQQLGIPGVFTNLTFRAYRYGTDFAGFAGRDLTPGGPVERPSAALAAAFAGLDAG